MKNDSALKIIVYSVLGLMVFWFLQAVMFPAGYGVSGRNNIQGYYRNGSEHGYISNFGSNNSFGSSILQLLLIVFVIALLVSVVMIVKNNLITPDNTTLIKGSFTGKSKRVTKPCLDCGKELNLEWKVCPHCGKDVVNQDKL